VRQREVRERRLRVAHEAHHEADWRVEGLTAADADATPEADQPVWALRLHGRASAA
jgi:hypothetical protein